MAYDVCRPFPEELTPDVIIHAASIASPTYYRRYPIETMDANVLGLRNVLNYAVTRIQEKRPLEGILFFSSSEVYGDPPSSRIPTDEEYWGNVSPIGPRSCYDESKRFGEALCVAFHRVHGVPVKIARPFNNYGPGLPMDDRRVIPDFASDVLDGKDIVMMSDGSPRRTFCYVADAIVGYYKLLELGRDAEPYNIGAEEPETSILDLARLVARVGKEKLGYTGRVITAASEDTAYLVDNPQRRCPSIAKARDDLSYVPQITLEEGIERSLLWYVNEKSTRKR